MVAKVERSSFAPIDVEYTGMFLTKGKGMEVNIDGTNDDYSRVKVEGKKIYIQSGKASLEGDFDGSFEFLVYDTKPMSIRDSNGEQVLVTHVSKEKNNESGVVFDAGKEPSEEIDEETRRAINHHIDLNGGW